MAVFFFFFNIPHHFISPFSLAIDMQVFELNHAVRELGTCCFSG